MLQNLFFLWEHKIGVYVMTYVASKFASGQSVIKSNGILNGTPWYGTGNIIKTGSGILFGTFGSFTSMTINGSTSITTSIDAANGHNGATVWLVPYSNGINLASTASKSWGLTTSSPFDAFALLSRPINMAVISASLSWPNKGANSSTYTYTGPGLLRFIDGYGGQSHNQGNTGDGNISFDIIINSPETSNADLTLVSMASNIPSPGIYGSDWIFSSLMIPFNGTAKVKLSMYQSNENSPVGNVCKLSYSNT